MTRRRHPRGQDGATVESRWGERRGVMLSPPHLANALRLRPVMPTTCDHKFIDSSYCLKCGWTPPTMIKARVTRDDGTVMIVMGITATNVARLKQGDPIFFDPAALMIEPGTTISAVTLFYGETEADLSTQLRSVLGPRTRIVVVPRGGDRPS